MTVLDKNSMFCKPKTILMFVLLKVSEIPVEGLATINTVLQGTQLISILVFTSLVSIVQMHCQGDSLIYSLSHDVLFVSHDIL